MKVLLTIICLCLVLLGCDTRPTRVEYVPGRFDGAWMRIHDIYDEKDGIEKIFLSKNRITIEGYEEGKLSKDSYPIVGVYLRSDENIEEGYFILVYRSNGRFNPALRFDFSRSEKLLIGHVVPTGVDDETTYFKIGEFAHLN